MSSDQTGIVAWRVWDSVTYAKSFVVHVGSDKMGLESHRFDSTGLEDLLSTDYIQSTDLKVTYRRLCRRMIV